jgi:DNA (cytosine-5)-methyltransferase 1
MQSTKFKNLKDRAKLDTCEIAKLTGYSERMVKRWEVGETEPKKIIYDWLEKQAIENYKNAKAEFTFIDLFAGIGGIRKAFESIGGKCVFTSEWDLACQKTYKANFDCDHEIAGDITLIPEDKIPKHNVLLAGFPCQPFSIAGVSKRNSLGSPHGFLCSTQGTLFFDVARIIAYHKPEAFLLENVKNLVSHDKGKTFKTILKTLRDELGYHVTWRVINGKLWVPQNRQRIYIVGFKKKNDFDINNMELPQEELAPKLGSILHPENGLEISEEPYTEGKKAKVNSKYTLSDKLWKYLQNYAERQRAKGNGFGFGLNTKDDTSRTLSARYYKDGSEILIAQKNKRPRKLTPRECARLMGFDKIGEKPMKIPVSDTQAYKQFGNSVVVPAMEAVAKYMKLWINSAVENKNKKEVKKLTAKTIKA